MTCFSRTFKYTLRSFEAFSFLMSSCSLICRLTTPNDAEIFVESSTKWPLNSVGAITQKIPAFYNRNQGSGVSAKYRDTLYRRYFFEYLTVSREFCKKVSCIFFKYSALTIRYFTFCEGLRLEAIVFAGT